MAEIKVRTTQHDKRYTVDYLISSDNGNNTMNVGHVMIWDNILEKAVVKYGERFGRYPPLEDKCRIMNLQHEDDLRYLKEIETICPKKE